MGKSEPPYNASFSGLAVAEVLAMADQPLVQLAGDAHLVAMAGQQDLFIEEGSRIDRDLARGGIIAQGTGWNAERGHSRYLAEVRLYQQEWLILARGAGLGSHRPLGFYSSGNYCISSPSNEREAMQKTGKGCPLGWTSSGSYCVKSR